MGRILFIYLILTASCLAYEDTCRNNVERRVGYSHDLSYLMGVIGGYTYSYHCDEPTYIKILGHIGTHHTGRYDTRYVNVMVAFEVIINGAIIPQSAIGKNVDGTREHYANVPIISYIEVPEGYNTIEIRGRSATSARPDQGGIMEIKPSTNFILYEIGPIDWK